MKVIDYINYLLPTVIKVATDRGYNPCLIFACLSQGALETGWCKSEAMIIHNAPFGIKYTGNGKYYESYTKEFINGVWITTTARFRAYDSLYDGVCDYFDLITTGRYKNTLNYNYVQDVIKELHKCGYASDPNYVTSVMGCYDTICKVLR